MRSSSKTYKIITLELNHEEATWLRGAVQNPIRPDESEEEYNIRDKIFMAIRNEQGPNDEFL